MKKILNKISKEYIIIIAVVLLSLFPLYIPGFLYTHDGIIHLFRSTGEYVNFTNFNFFSKISFNIINGFGYGWGIFYPPLSSFIPALFMCLGFSLFTAEKIFLILASVFAGIFGYKMFKELFKNNFISLLSTIIYVLSPYKINQIIIRGAMGEVLLFTFLPLVILGIIKLLNKEYKYKYYLIIGACGIVYSHTISTAYTCIFAALILILNFKKILDRKTLLEFIKTLTIIILISLPILAPMLQHKSSNLYKISDITCDVSDRVVHPGQLIGGSLESKEVENTSYFCNDKEMNYMIGLTAIIILIMLPFIYKDLKKNKEDLKNIIIFSILFIISVLMIITPFIWNKIELLDVIQYPWRILTFTVIFISIIAGYVLKYIVNKENKYAIFLFVVGFSFIFVFMIGTKAKFAKTLNNDFDFYNHELSQEDDYGSISFPLGYAHEYLPKQLTVEKLKSRGKDINILNGEAKISDYYNERGNLLAKITSDSQVLELEFPRIFYYGYILKANGKNIPYSISEDGFIYSKLQGDNEYSVELTYEGSILYKSLNIIAIVTTIGYSIYLLNSYISIKTRSK